MSYSVIGQVQEVEISDIQILNPRDRNKSKFQALVQSISAIGLKRPIKISRLPEAISDRPFVLVCGQGRIEAFKTLGRSTIPAIVVSLSEEDCYVQSLVENIARRTPTTIETIKELSTLADRGYSLDEIANKTGLGRDYLSGMLRLLRSTEHRLLAAVERGDIPISVAIKISAAPDNDLQAALNQAYQKGELRGKKLQTAMRIAKERQKWGKSALPSRANQKKTLTAQSLVKHYRRETDRQKNLIRRANLTEARLAVVKGALRELFSDEHFVTLLRAEGIDTLPTQLADILKKEVA